MNPLLGRLFPKQTIFFQCDIQKRFLSYVFKMNHVIHIAKMMAKVSKVLKIPIIATEQNSKAFGKTFEEIT